MPPRPPPRGFRFQLSVPAPVPILGDVLDAAIGVPLALVLQPLFYAPPTNTPNGQTVYNLYIPDGERFVRSLRQLGAIGFGSEGGELVVYLPPSFCDSFVSSTERTIPSLAGRMVVTRQVVVDQLLCASVRVPLQPGQQAVLRMGMLGAIGIAVPLESVPPRRTGDA